MGAVQIISLICSTIFLSFVMYFTGKHKLKDKYAFFWILISIGCIILVFLIPLFNFLSNMVGINYMPSLIIMLALFFILGIAIYMTSVISVQQDNIKSLIHEIAFVNKDLEELKKKISEFN